MKKFQHTYVNPKRTRYVYSDLAQTQIAGGRETDLLREVTISTAIKGGGYTNHYIYSIYLFVKMSLTL